MERTTLHYIVDVALGIDFLILFITGLVKFPGLPHALGLGTLKLPMGIISNIHDWSGIALALLVFLHLVLHWSWISTMTRKVFRRK